MLFTFFSGKQQLNWWIKAWQFSGLDEPGEAFDIVVMVHPSGVPDIKEQCTPFLNKGATPAWARVCGRSPAVPSRKVAPQK